MAAELTELQRQRLIFVGKIFGYMHQALGEKPCTSFFCVEDDFETQFHACFCTPGTLIINRTFVGDGDAPL